MSRVSNNLVVWVCPDKHQCMIGFLAPLESTLRFCRHGIGWDGVREVYCRKPMEVCYDERPKVQGPLTEFASDDEKRLRLEDGIRAAQKNLVSGQMMAEEIVRQLGIALKGIRKGSK